MKSANSFGAFSLRVFEHVQSGDKSREGYLEHLETFRTFANAESRRLRGDVGHVALG